MTPEKAKTLLDKKHYSLYKLIYERFLASQMAEAKYDSTQMEIDNSGYTFKASGKIMLFPGYTAVYRETEAKKDDDEAESAELLPDLKQGEEVLCEKITTEQKFTKPPLRYTDASLVKAMEEKGIGRPSTYATIIAKLNQKYVKKEGKYMKPVPVSYAVSDMLVKCFPDVMDVGFTADMETKLDKIEEGGQRWQNVIADFYPDFEKNLKNASTYGDEVTDIKCEKCGRPMIRLTGKYGKYLACSGYPECHNIVSEGEQEISAVPCPKCGENMVVKTGKFGTFLACPNYPDCKTTLPYPEENGSPKFYGICPECGSPMAQKKTKKGKIFYGCSAYPDCKFLSWDIPTGKKCPKCGSAIVQTARGYIRCSNKDCDYKEGKANTNGGNDGGENAAPKKTYTPLQSEDFDAPPLMDEPIYGDE